MLDMLSSLKAWVTRFFPASNHQVLTEAPRLVTTTSPTVPTNPPTLSFAYPVNSAAANRPKMHKAYIVG